MKTLNLIIFVFAFSLFILASCRKDKERNTISGQLLIKETNKPLGGFTVMFDVAEGSGIFGTVEKNRYSATSDNNGYFSFEAEKKHRDKWFIVDYSNGYICTINMDTNNVQFKYRMNDEENYIAKDSKTKLYYSPRGRVEFYTEDETFTNLNADKIIVKTRYGSDTLVDSRRGKTINFETSSYQDFTYIAMKNGSIIREVNKKIYIRHDCIDMGFGMGSASQSIEVKF